MDIKKSTFSRWSKMTDNNEHNKVRISIAKKFELVELEKSFKTISKAHEIIGYLEYHFMIARSNLTKDMLISIENEHGIEMKNNVNACL